MIRSSSAGMSGLRRSGETGVLFSIESNSAAVVSPRKGSMPVATSYSTAPNEKRSVRPSSSLPSACSGDMYATVPRALPGLVRCSSRMLAVAAVAPAFSVIGEPIFARPKSRILA